MGNDLKYWQTDTEPQRVPINPMVNQPQGQRNSSPNDIEVIDLDDPRGQIKPTTWHK